MSIKFKTLLSLLFTLLFLVLSVLPSFALAPTISVSATYASGKYYDQLLEVELTGDMRKDIVAIAKSQVGYLEGSSAGQVSGLVEGSQNYTEYNNYMYGGKTGGWCGMFVSWCAAMAGVPTSVLNRATSAKPYYYDGYGFNFISDKAGVSKLAGSDFKSYYDLPTKGGSYIPQPGDLIFFGYYNAKSINSLPRSCFKHVGLVEYCTVTYDENGSATYMEIHTVEGNVSNKVREKTYKLYPTSSGYVYEDTFIAAFGVPAYTTVKNPSYNSYYDLGGYDGVTLKYGSEGEAVIKLQLALRVLAEIYPSITAPTVNGTFDQATKNALTQYQTLKKLSVDGKCGPQSWASIRSVLIYETGRIASDFIIDENGTLLLYKGSGESDTLPDNCKRIASYAFFDNHVLKLLYAKTTPSLDKKAFENTTASLVTQIGGGSSLPDTGPSPDEFPCYTITFDVNGTKTVVTCPAGDTPVFTGSTDVPDDELRYFFAGWDTPIVPATENVTYTAIYYTVSATPLSLTGSCSSLTFSKGKLYFDIYLKNAPGVSAFSFSTDYSMYLAELSFASFSPSFAGVSCDASLDGILQFSYDGSCLAAGDLRIGTVVFNVSENVFFGEDDTPYPIQLFFSVTDGHMRHQLPDGQEIDLSVSCDLVEVLIYDRLIYDYSEDNQLTISDAALLLDLLSNPISTLSSKKLKTDDLSIYDVSTILDLLNVD